MNNIQFWIWLIVIIVTFVARARKQRQSRPNQTQVPDNSPAEEPAGPVTFEDILREIQESKKAKYGPAPKEEPAKELELVPGERKLYQERQQSYEIYEKGIQEAFQRPSLEETMKLEDTIVRFGQFKGYEPTKRHIPGIELRKEISTRAGFRKAFILSEILHRRF
jgi:hypothetical protein